MSLLDVEMLYHSMLIRISKQYSPEELSFLIGEQPSFICKMEELQRVEYRMNILWKKHWIVSEIDPALLFPRRPVEEEMGDYQLIKTVFADKVMYQMNQLSKFGEVEVKFLLRDDNHEVDYYPDSTKQQQKSLRTAIQALIDLNYFSEERSTYQLFLKCDHLVNNYFRPIDLYHVLTEFTKQKVYPKLLRVKTKYSGYKYVLTKSKA